MAYPYSEAVNRILAARQIHSSQIETPSMPAHFLRQQFTVLNESPHLQGRAWCDYVSRILEINIARRHLNHGFHGELDTYVMQDLIFLDSRTDPVIQTRSNARISTDNMRDYCFHVAVDGIIETVSGALTPRKSEQFVPGILALDMNQKMRMVRPTHARVLAFFLPRKVVEAQIPDAESIHGTTISYTSPLTRLLQEHLKVLCNMLQSMPDQVAEQTIRDCAQLILAAFAKQQRLDGSAASAARNAIHFQVRHYVKNHLREEELTPEHILNVFQLSRTTLYRIFEAEGGLVTYIRNCRLRAAADDLLEMRRLSIKVIADDLGFGSASDFTRAFRRSYGISPQDFRALGIDTMQR